MPKRRSIAAATLAAGLAIGGGAACTPTEDDNGTTKPPANSEPAEKKDPKEEDPQKAEEANEKKDVTKLELVDRSTHGFTDVRVSYEITNQSSKKSDYTITYEVVNNETDKRVWDSTLLETNIKPGQEVTGQDYINIPEGTSASQYELNMTNIDRSESF